jgi:hypothetical protein
MRRPTDEELQAVIFRIERWKATDAARDAGPAHYHFNDGVRAAIAWALGEDLEPLMRLDGVNASAKGI